MNYVDLFIEESTLTSRYKFFPIFTYLFWNATQQTTHISLFHRIGDAGAYDHRRRGDPFAEFAIYAGGADSAHFRIVWLAKCVGKGDRAGGYF